MGCHGAPCHTPVITGRSNILRIPAMLRICVTGRSSFGDDPEIESAFSQKRWDEARRLIEKELAAMPSDWSPLCGKDSFVSGSFWDIEEFSAYSAHSRVRGETRMIGWISPSFSKRWWQLAVINKEEGKYEEALGCIERGLQLEPDHPYLWVQRGLILCAAARHDEAVFAYQTAASIRIWASPSDRAWALRSQGYALIELGRLAEARSVYARSLELEPDNENAKNELDYIVHLLEKQERQRTGSIQPKTAMDECAATTPLDGKVAMQNSTNGQNEKDQGRESELGRNRKPTPSELFTGWQQGGEAKLKEMLENMPEPNDEDEEE